MGYILKTCVRGSRASRARGLFSMNRTWFELKAGLHVRHKHKHKPRVNRDDASTSARKRNAGVVGCGCVRVIDASEIAAPNR